MSPPASWRSAGARMTEAPTRVIRTLDRVQSRLMAHITRIRTLGYAPGSALRSRICRLVQDDREVVGMAALFGLAVGFVAGFQRKTVVPFWLVLVVPLSVAALEI